MSLSPEMREKITDKDKLELIELGIEDDNLFGDGIVKILKSMENDESKIRAIELGRKANRIFGYHIVNLLSSLKSNDSRLKVVELGINDGILYSDYMIETIKLMKSDESKLVVIEQGVEKGLLTKHDIVQLATILENDESEMKLLELGIDEFDLSSKEIAQIAKMVKDDKNRLDIIKDNRRNLTFYDFAEILSGFNSLNNENEEYFKFFLEKLDIPSDNLKFSFKILNAFGPKVFNIEGALFFTTPNALLFTKEASKLIGEENIYNLFKYYVYCDNAIHIDKVLENPKSFRKYQEFRKTFTEQKQIEIMDIKDALCEFNENSKLLEECMEIELTLEETRMLKGAIKEKNVVLQSRDELITFPEKRREVIDYMIENSPEDALIYIFTGMDLEEYDEKIRQYINNEMLDRTIQEFGNEALSELGIIKATNEFIELIRGMDEEKQKEILRIYNNDLANEFTENGSTVSTMRSAYEDIEIKIRKVYGKELSLALRNTKLPHSQVDEKDKEVQIIKLQGEKFKLLIHGIDAYGKGTGKFEKREIGKAYICTSLISEEHLERARANRYYGFINVGENALIEEANDDMYSYEKDKEITHVSSHGKNIFLTSEKMIEESKYYNEIVLWREYLENDGKKKEIWPDYIVCFNEITDGDREEAKRLGIPIVLIDEKAYEKNMKENKTDGKPETNEVEMPEEYTETKFNMMAVLREASNNCSAHAEKEVIQKIMAEMEKELEVGRALVH